MKKLILSIFVLSLQGRGFFCSAQNISAGAGHSLYVCSINTPMACGYNGAGGLGDGTTVDDSIPIQVSSLNGITATAGGLDHSLFLKNDGTVWACGSNSDGQLGDGTTADKHTPVQVSSLSGITAIAAGQYYSLFLRNDGTVWACGYNSNGQLGDGTTINQSSPVKVSAPSGITAISTGESHSLFLRNDGTVWACGVNQFGQLGIGTTLEKHTPVQVNSLTAPCVAIAAGENHSLFLKNDSTVWACGSNSQGQLGDGTTADKSTPVQDSSLIGIISIGGGGHEHSLFLKNDGTVWACGINGQGQLGDGTTITRHTPVKVSSLSGIVSITAGWYHSLFLRNDGAVWACGRNSYGQLGDGTTTQRNTPVQATGLCTVGIPVATFAASSNTICTGSCISFTDSSASPTAWSWNFGNGNTSTAQNPASVCYTASATYTVTLIVSNPYGSDTAATTIKVNPLPAVTLAAFSPDTVCINASPFALTGGSPAGGVYSGAGVSAGNFNASTAGGGWHKIIYTYTDANNCPNSDSAQLFVDVCTGVQSFSNNSYITVYPNPSNGVFALTLKGTNNSALLGGGQIEIYNVYGQIVYSTIQHPDSHRDNNTTIDLSSHPQGIYFLQLKTSEGVITKKLVVSK